MTRRIAMKLGPAVIALAAVAVGCQAPSKNAASSQPTTREVAGAPRELPAIANDVPKDPQEIPKRLVQLDVYVMTLPAGGVSRNEEFWKRVDEGGLDPRQYDTLRRNGVRVGEADVADWKHFKDIIDAQPVETQMNQFVGVEAKSQELLVRKEVPIQHIWTFGPNGLGGKTYEQSDNLWILNFQPTPRQPDFVRVTLCPLVRSVRKQLTLISRPKAGEPQEREFAYTHREALLTLNLTADVKSGRFLIVAPSAESKAYTVGDAFLTAEGRGMKEERVMLIVPQFVAVQTVKTWVRPTVRKEETPR